MSKEALEIFRVQLYLQRFRKYGRRWPEYFRGLALKLHFMGPRAYRFLSRFLALPTERTLRTWLKDIHVEPGVLPEVLNRLEAKLKDLPLKDRTCMLMFDEMSIKQHLQYDRGSDVVLGFVDNGQEREPQLANSALLVMLSGISTTWIQPLAYVLSKSAASANTLQALLVQLIQRLQSANIFVKVVVCDQGSSNCALARNLEVSPSQPYFLVNDHKVYFMFDPPHLMKTTRNLLLKYDLLNGSAEKKVQWAFIKQFYESNYPLKARLAPKLTENHINPTVFNRMRVKFATQVLSDSVSAGIAVLIVVGEMPPAAAATSDFLQQMDILFDTLNSSSTAQSEDKKMRYAISASTKHKEILQSAAERISNWKFIGCAREPPTVNGWQVTINAVLALWDDLHENSNFEHLLTRRLNQDPLENMFGQFRQMHGSNETPNAFQFVAGLKHTLASKVVNATGRGNCEATELSLILNELKRMPFSTVTSVPPEEPEHDLPSSETSDTSPDIGPADLNAHFAYAGHLVELFLKMSHCSNCSELLKGTQDDLQDPSSVFLYLRANEQTCVPSSAFFEYYQKLETTFQANVVENPPTVDEPLEIDQLDASSQSDASADASYNQYCDTDFTGDEGNFELPSQERKHLRRAQRRASYSSDDTVKSVQARRLPQGLTVLFRPIAPKQAAIGVINVPDIPISDPLIFQRLRSGVSVTSIKRIGKTESVKLVFVTSPTPKFVHIGTVKFPEKPSSTLHLREDAASKKSSPPARPTIESFIGIAFAVIRAIIECPGLPATVRSIVSLIIPLQDGIISLSAA
ncbi:uncharacterized protein LOC135389170 [Ornithodoros turicata]|uniref:uncharacterized protein LOC135389170 n=1 Tax=Ornithodoros turicata TaxID=34597 RepID=UPI003138DC9C